MDFNKYKPILVVPAIPSDSGINFFRYDRQLTLTGDVVPIVWKILMNCNGYNSVLDIINNSQLDKSIVISILSNLEQNKLITDSCKQYQHFHEISNYPARYICNLTDEEIKLHKNGKRKPTKKGSIINYNLDYSSFLFNLQKVRKSCRSFSSKKLSLFQMGNICDYAYSLSRHAVPSGGALFPLKIFCVVPRDQVDFSAGYYEYNAECGNLVLYKTEPDLEQLKYCYNDSTLAFNSPLQIIIAADLNRQTYKYSNRGYRLTLIEVGQVAQNITLYCQENGLSTCELGGILDENMAAELEIVDDKISPILAIAIGYRSPLKNNFEYKTLLEQLSKSYVGDHKPIKNFGIYNFDVNDASFFGAWANYGNNGNRTAGATGFSYYEATAKAVVEAYERYCSSLTRIDYYGIPYDESLFFYPDDIAPLSLEQRKRQKLSLYNKTKKINWTKDITETFYLPTDFVFYGHKSKSKLFLSDSSGIAAFSDYEGAKKRALAELIERDAIMRCWYQFISPFHVNPKQIPLHVKNRMSYWKSKNRKVHILDIDSEFTSVFLVVIVSDTYPCFVSGSAAVIDSCDNAIIKAMQEAEYNLLLALKNPVVDCPEIQNIKSPMDHGQYYYFLNNSKKIDWLWNNNNFSKKIHYNDFDLKIISKKLNAVFVDLSENKVSKIKVVRAISKKLIPISFGFGCDYFLHPEVQKLKFDKRSRNLPHFFA